MGFAAGARCNRLNATNKDRGGKHALCIARSVRSQVLWHWPSAWRRPAPLAQTSPSRSGSSCRSQPGGTSDILARLIGPKLQDAIGQPVVVENKTGAGGNIGADFVAKADKDGHTLLLLDVSTLAISPNLLASMTYSPTKDLAPVGLISFAPYVLAVHPSVPVKTVAELVAHAKANPGKMPFGNAGIGVANHISAVQLEKSVGRSVQARALPGRRRCHQGHRLGRKPGHPQRRDGNRLVRRAGPAEGPRRVRRQARARASRTCRPSRS